jgi:HD-GYP domain-containing protein (c-di-GMP phosphodiesterase class II)
MKVRVATTREKAELGEAIEDAALAQATEQAMTLLATCVRNAIFYGIQHSVAREAVKGAADALGELLAERARIVLNIRGDEFILGNLPLRDPVGVLVPLAEEFTTRGVGKLTFLPGVQASELEAVAELLITNPQALELQGDASDILSHRSVTHVVVEPADAEQRPEDLKQREAIEIYEDAVETIKKTMSAVEKGQAIDGAEVRAVVEEILGSVLYDSSALLSLAAIKSYDEYLYEHSVNVCIVAMMFGYTLGLTEAQLVDLGVASILHDIGKVFVPLDIVRKPGPLTEEEWMLMHTHPAVGARILGTTAGVPELAPVVAFEHHIKHDRSGYPKLTRPRLLNFFSHIVTVVDCYDSLTTVRPYRAPVRPEQAVGWMLYSGRGQFEPRLLARFAALMKLYPPGAIVRLDSREWAVITGGSEHDLARPVLRLLVDPNGMTIRGTKIVDLSQRDTHGGYAHSIVDCLQPVSKIAEVSSVLNR